MMAVPWLRLIDAAIGLTDVVRRAKGSSRGASRMALAPSALGALETRLAGVVVGALREAFDRDHQRYELEREQIEAERRRAEQALRLELMRQAGDRELARMRMLAIAALTSLLGTFLVAARLLSGVGGRVSLGLAWLALLAALGMAFGEQARISRVLASADDGASATALVSNRGLGVAALWLLIVGLAVAALGVLVS